MENQKFKVSEIQISYRPDYKMSERPQINSSKLAYQILLETWNEDHLQFIEEFKVILLNRQNRVLGIVPIGQGGLSGVIADPKVIFGAALRASSSGIIVCHNHPSGNCSPSEADIRLTRTLVAGGKLLGIEVHDHIILCQDGYYSFGDEGLMC